MPTVRTRRYRGRVDSLANGRAAWAIPWPYLPEFLSIATHPRVYDPPTPLELALHQIDAWLKAPSLVLLAETESHWPELRTLVESAHVAGPQVHDARISALCRQHGVRELWSADRNFGRFPGLHVSNPLVSALAQ